DGAIAAVDAIVVAPHLDEQDGALHGAIVPRVPCAWSVAAMTYPCRKACKLATSCRVGRRLTMPMRRREAMWVALVRSALPLCMWCMFAVWILVDWRRDPYDPSLVGTRAYGHNGAGSLELGLGVSLFELAVFYAVTCPFLMKRPRLFFLVPLLSIVPFVGWF